MKSKLLNSDGDTIIHELTSNEPKTLEQVISWILKDDPNDYGKIRIQTNKKALLIEYGVNQVPTETFSDKDLLLREICYALSIRHAWSDIVDYIVQLKETNNE